MNTEKLGEIVIFNNEDGEVKVQIDAVNETIWLNQKGMAELFGVNQSAISKHLINVYDEGELSKEATYSKMELVQQEGNRDVKRLVEFYNLDAIIAVGYRVNSKRATQFRIWATNTLREYMVKGYLLDDERFINGYSLTHFKQLLDRIRAIRLSEKVFYQQIKDIYALSEDYNKDDERTIKFFQKVQNKLLWAVSGHTAAELMYYRVNSELPMMGLTSTEKNGVVKLTDALIGKNFLREDEISVLKLIVEQYLAFAETQALSHTPMMMKDWEEKLDVILTMNRKNILETKGKISRELADKKARAEYEKFQAKQKMEQRIASIKELSDDVKAVQIEQRKKRKGSRK